LLRGNVMRKGEARGLVASSEAPDPAAESSGARRRELS
jgi:hypothetical protein